MDDQLFPSYVSAKARQRTHKFDEKGDAFVRELEFSRITLRLVSKESKSGDDENEHVIAKLTGQTLTTLQQCLYKATELTMRSEDGISSKVVVKLKYLPVLMQLDPSESINNSGTLRVDILDAAELPAADRNGFSDPYCKFKLNGKEIHKTKVQKKTLHPAWNEFFETQIQSRTAAQFRCDVYDWDFGDKADFLGGTDLNLSLLEPLKPQELTYHLDGKSGVLRLKMHFKPAYVTRAKQGTSTLTGTFAPAGKVVGAPVKGVAKVGGAVGKGASFLKRGLTGRGSREDTANVLTKENPNAEAEVATPRQSGAVEASAVPAATAGATSASAISVPSIAAPATPSGNRLSRAGSAVNSPIVNGAESGTANLTIVSASGYPASADVRVHVKVMGPKGARDVFKTKAIKSSTGVVEYDPTHENLKVNCTADTQFQIAVKDHGTFSSKDLGEGVFFISDQGSGAEQSVKAGEGTVTVQTSFTPSENRNGYAESLRPTTSDGPASPDSRRERRSIFGRSKHDEK